MEVNKDGKDKRVACNNCVFAYPYDVLPPPMAFRFEKVSKEKLIQYIVLIYIIIYYIYKNYINFH
jgi:hypothetical protein